MSALLPTLHEVAVLAQRCQSFYWCFFGELKMLKKLQDKALAASVLVLASVPAMAQTVTDPFEAAMTEATTKVGSYAAALVGLGAVAVVFMIALKYVKKIPRAS